MSSAANERKIQDLEQKLDSSVNSPLMSKTDSYINEKQDIEANKPRKSDNMPSIRQFLLTLMVVSLLTITIVSAATTNRSPGNVSPPCMEDQQAFRELLDTVEPAMLHDVLHQHMTEKYQHGVYEDDKDALAAVYRQEPAVAHALVEAAKANAMIELAKRQVGSNSTSTQAPSTTSAVTLNTVVTSESATTSPSSTSVSVAPSSTSVLTTSVVSTATSVTTSATTSATTQAVSPTTTAPTSTVAPTTAAPTTASSTQVVTSDGTTTSVVVSVSSNTPASTSAASTNSGRAVARIPRVSGGGTHRAGQAAFGNMCRSGRMFAPTKVWRKWHQKINLGQKRFATVSALAASGVPALLFARGHQISEVAEVPLVINSEVFEGAKIARTSAAAGLLKTVGALADVEKVKGSRKLRAGKGKLRGRRHRQRRGPLVVYDGNADGKELVRAFRNLPGVETCDVFSLNLLQLAPGGHLGRFIIWSSSAFKALDDIYGTTTAPSALKKDFLLPSNVVSQADIGRLINSSELQSVIRAARGSALTKRAGVQKKNPLLNKQVLLRLNPYAAGYSKEKIGTKGLDAGKPERINKTQYAQVLKED